MIRSERLSGLLGAPEERFDATTGRGWIAQDGQRGREQRESEQDHDGGHDAERQGAPRSADACGAASLVSIP